MTIVYISIGILLLGGLALLFFAIKAIYNFLRDLNQDVEDHQGAIRSFRTSRKK